MFRHVALFRWSESTTDAQKRAVADALARLPSQISELRAYTFGADAALAGGNWDFAIVADFDDAEGWRAYTVNAEHQRVLAEVIRPVLAERAAVQYAY